MENISSIMLIISGVIASLGGLFLLLVIYQAIKKDRFFRFSWKAVSNYLLGYVVLVPVLGALYVFPMAYQHQDFWLDSNAQFAQLREALMFFGASLVMFYTLVRVAIFLPHKNEYWNLGSQLALISLFPGVANALIVMIINQFITKDIDPRYLLFFFAVTIFVYVVTVRISKRKIATLGILVAHRFSILIANKTFKIPFAKYEKVKNGKIYTILNDDINAIFALTQNAIDLYTAVITTVIIMVYMYSLDLISSLFLLAVTGFILGLLALMSGPLKRTGYKARDKRDQHNSLISGLLNGFKELVIHRVKRDRFQEDLEKTSQEACDARKDNIFVGIDAGLFSELSFTLSIGVSCLLFPIIFNLDKEIVTSYVLAVLFLMGPVGVLIKGVPQFFNTKVSWKRIKGFIDNAEADTDKEEIYNIPYVDTIEVKDVHFTYETENKDESITYGIGPVNFEVNNGELVFIIGGNGSGKTTFLKLLVGLYSPTAGEIMVNGNKTTRKELSECFSIIFSDFYLFKKIYDLKEHRLEQVYEWFEILGLSDKVKIEDGAFTTINLSQGQRKRLAIIKSYLEDRPVYFFDEVAADLDPEFRSFFYNHLMMKIKEEGKILIIISHDDKYFHLADKIYKMDMGQISEVKRHALEVLV